MLLIDANVLILSHRQDLPGSAGSATWLTNALAGDETIAFPDSVLSAFLRIVTDRRVFEQPTTLEEAAGFIEFLLVQPGVSNLQPGRRFWPRMIALCRESDARGPLIPDAYLAALAMEAGATLITNDRGFARFPALRWRRPSLS